MNLVLDIYLLSLQYQLQKVYACRANVTNRVLQEDGCGKDRQDGWNELTETAAYLGL